MEESDREAAEACLLQCISCARYCHTYCVPEGIKKGLENDLGTIKRAGDQLNGGYKCVHCIQCAGCGGKASAFDKPLHYWNLRRIDEKAPDEVVPTCGECLFRFKHEKEFCPLCYKLYPPEEPLEEDEEGEGEGEGEEAGAVGVAEAEGGVVPSSSSASMAVIKQEDGSETTSVSVSVPAVPAATTTAVTTNVTNASAAGSGTDEEDNEDESPTIVATGAHGGSPHTLTESMDVEGREADQEMVPSSSSSSSSADAGTGAGVGAEVVKKEEAPIQAPSGAVVLKHKEKEKPSAEDEAMVQCNECSRWVHALCEGIDEAQYQAMTRGTHPVWGEEYLCPHCRVVSGLRVVQELDAIDVTGIFQFPVSEATAPTYYDVVRNPMDLETMEKKAMSGLYKSLQSLRQDFELMCLNAMVFNKVGDEYWRESRTFLESGLVLFQNMQRSTTMSTFGAEIALMTKKLDNEAAAEVVAGETAKKEQAYRDRKEQEAAIRAKYDAYYYNNVKKTRQGLELENELKKIEALNKQDEAFGGSLPPSAQNNGNGGLNLPPAGATVSAGLGEDGKGKAEGEAEANKPPEYFDLSLQQRSSPMSWLLNSLATPVRYSSHSACGSP